MPYRVYLLIILVAAMVCGCGKSPVERELDHAEAIMEERPDSALILLLQIDGAALRGESRARHALLLSQAYDKNYIDLTNDSLISIAYDYYGRGKDLYHRMLAYHYYAVVNKNAERYATALQAELMAHDDAQALKDTFNLSRITSVIARIYVAGGDYKEAVRWELTGLEYAKALNNPVWIQISYLNLGEEHMVLLRFHEAIQYADSALAVFAEPSKDALNIKYFSYYGLDMYHEMDSILAVMNAAGFAPKDTIAYYGGKSNEEIIATQNEIIALQNQKILEITSNSLSEALYKYNIDKSAFLNSQIKEREDKIGSITNCMGNRT